jgi:hypothetical protein
MAAIRRDIDLRKLVNELANNKVDSLELIREALSNAVDHGAKNVWIRSMRGEPPAQSVELILINDGEGMTVEQLKAFWGVSTSVKPPGQAAIGYKGHGSKLFFSARRLSVATRRDVAEPWKLTSLDRPLESSTREIDEVLLPAEHPLAKELAAVDLYDGVGVAIFVEGCQFRDADRFLARRPIESYVDWFTVMGDVRSGLFNTRAEFHDVVANRRDLTRLRIHERDLIPINVWLRINGEPVYAPLGFGPTPPASNHLLAWREDAEHWRKTFPGMAAFGHRFADHHAAEKGARRVRDDLTALCLSTLDRFGDDPKYALIMRVEGQRRQLQTYLEGSRQPVGGEYEFDDRFGLWLCKDFIPIVKRNDLLVAALERATEKSKKRLRFDLSRTRFWQVFINNQDFLLTANRNDLANMREHDARIVEMVADRIAEELKEDAFREWIENLQQSIAAGRRSKEIDAMQSRVEVVTKWFRSTGGDVEPTKTSLALLDAEESLRLPRPNNEQELFYLYAVLSSRFVMPLRVIEYDTRLGIDAIAQVRDRKLFDPPIPYARVEFKYQLQGNRAIGHFFDAIDAIVCWTVTSPGPLPEAGDTPQMGELSKRAKPRSTSGLDTYEVEYTDAKGKPRLIPVLVLDRIFAKKRGK